MSKIGGSCGDAVFLKVARFQKNRGKYPLKRRKALSTVADMSFWLFTKVKIEIIRNIVIIQENELSPVFVSRAHGDSIFA